MTPHYDAQDAIIGVTFQQREPDLPAGTHNIYLQWRDSHQNRSYKFCFGRQCKLPRVTNLQIKADDLNAPYSLQYSTTSDHPSAPLDHSNSPEYMQTYKHPQQQP